MAIFRTAEYGGSSTLMAWTVLIIVEIKACPPSHDADARCRLQVSMSGTWTCLRTLKNSGERPYRSCDLNSRGLAIVLLRERIGQMRQVLDLYLDAGSQIDPNRCSGRLRCRCGGIGKKMLGYWSSGTGIASLGWSC